MARSAERLRELGRSVRSFVSTTRTLCARWLLPPVRRLLRLAFGCTSILVSALLGAGCVILAVTPGGHEHIAYVARFLTGEAGPTANDVARHLTLGVAVFGGGVIVALIQEVTKTVPTLTQFVLHEKLQLDKLTGPCATFFAVSASLVLSVWAWAHHQEEPPPVQDSTSIRFIVDGDNGSDEHETALATFLVTFAEDATPQSLKARSGPGLDISRSDRDLLKSLALTLANCTKPSGRSPEVHLIGSASSGPFESLSMAESNQLNTELANVRAELVAEVLRSNALEVAWVEPRIVVHRWKSFEDMVQARRFRDRHPDGTYSPERARLTRRVEVRLIGAGACEFDLPTRIARSG